MLLALKDAAHVSNRLVSRHSPCESRLHSASENVYHINIRMVCLNYNFCTMCHVLDRLVSRDENQTLIFIPRGVFLFEIKTQIRYERNSGRRYDIIFGVMIYFLETFF